MVGIQGTTASSVSKNTANHAARPKKADEEYPAYRDKYFSTKANNCTQTINNYFRFRLYSEGLTVHDERLTGKQLLTTMQDKIQESRFSEPAKMLKRCSDDEEFCKDGQQGRIYSVEALESLDIMGHQSILNLLATRQTAPFLFALTRDVAWQRPQEPENINCSEYQGCCDLHPTGLINFFLSEWYACKMFSTYDNLSLPRKKEKTICLGPTLHVLFQCPCVSTCVDRLPWMSMLSVSAKLVLGASAHKASESR